MVQELLSFQNWVKRGWASYFKVLVFDGQALVKVKQRPQIQTHTMFSEPGTWNPALGTWHLELTLDFSLNNVSVLSRLADKTEYWG